MNREFKFRAWDNKSKEWLLGYELPNLGGFSMFGETMLFMEWSDIINRFILQQRDRKPEDLILMQYTGLKDKNGKEIYEGDILIPSAYVGSSNKGFICLVIQDKGMFGFEPNGSLIQKFNPLYTSLENGKKAGNEFVIIGNKYSNPELLSSNH